MWDNPPTACTPTIISQFWDYVGLLLWKLGYLPFQEKKLILRLSPPTPTPSPKALNHCMDGLLQQQTVVWCLQFDPPSPSTDIHIRTFPSPSVLASAAPRHQSVCSASRQHLGNLSSLPPFLPSSRYHLCLAPRILFSTIHAFLGMSEWVGATGEGDKEENGDDTEKERERENRDKTDQPACRPLQTWPRRKAPGAAGRARVLMCLLSFTHQLFVCCGCERWTGISACRLNIHDTLGVQCWACVCVYALQVNICHLIVFVKS